MPSTIESSASFRTYLTVENPDQSVTPLTVKQKFALFAKETFDPFTVGRRRLPERHFRRSTTTIRSMGMASVRMPSALARRWPTLPRRISFRTPCSHLCCTKIRGTSGGGRNLEFGIASATRLSRVVVTRTDTGNDRFNYSGIIGMSMGIALSNAYYPDASVSGKEVAYRFGTSLAASALGNLLPEFWPDVHEKFFHRKPRAPNPSASGTRRIK